MALFVGLAVWRVWDKPSLGLLAGYSVLLFAETVLIRRAFTGNHFQAELFWSWKAWDRQKNQILSNVIMFIPIGILTGRLWKWRGLFAALGMSVTVELLQLITQRGLCEFDDVADNVLGALIGVVIALLARRIAELLSKRYDWRIKR